MENTMVATKTTPKTTRRYVVAQSALFEGPNNWVASTSTIAPSGLPRVGVMLGNRLSLDDAKAMCEAHAKQSLTWK